MNKQSKSRDRPINAENKLAVAGRKEVRGTGEMGERDREIQAPSNETSTSRASEAEPGESSQRYRNHRVRWLAAATRGLSTASHVENFDYYFVHLNRK